LKKKNQKFKTEKLLRTSYTAPFSDIANALFPDFISTKENKPCGRIFTNYITNPTTEAELQSIILIKNPGNQS
jgi:hypothetical protein